LGGERNSIYGGENRRGGFSSVEKKCSKFVADGKQWGTYTKSGNREKTL